MKFLGVGNSGDEVFEKMAATPYALAKILRSVASKLEADESGLNQTARSIRRTVIASDAPFVAAAVALLTRYASRANIEKAEKKYDEQRVESRRI